MTHDAPTSCLYLASYSLRRKNAAFAAKQVADVASKVQKCQGDLAASSRYTVGGSSKGKKESEVQGAAHDAAVVSYSVMHGLMTQLIKHKVFNGEGPRS
jgi:hypothetical protein